MEAVSSCSPRKMLSSPGPGSFCSAELSRNYNRKTMDDKIKHKEEKEAFKVCNSVGLFYVNFLPETSGAYYFGGKGRTIKSSQVYWAEYAFKPKDVNLEKRINIFPFDDKEIQEKQVEGDPELVEDAEL